MLKLKKHTLVVVISGAHKGKKQTVVAQNKNYLFLSNILGLSSKKKSYHIKINRSNVKIDRSNIEKI